MRTKHTATELSMRFRASKTSLRHTQVVFLLTGSKAVPLLWFFFLCASVVSYVTFVLILFISFLSFIWCLRRSVLHECAISWVSLLIFSLST